MATATFGAGCFWGVEEAFRRLPGVTDAAVGYAGGHLDHPTYRQVCTDRTGHAEVVQVEYDPAVVSYEKLLKVFWSSHDPTTLNSQGPDFGTQYRSIILYEDEDQRRAALKSIADLTASRAFRAPIVTEVVPLTEFYPAERYHQNYYRTHPRAAYSMTYIAPKLRKLKVK